MVKEYKMFQSWERTKEDENFQLEALFDSLYAAGKVTKEDLILFRPRRTAKGYLNPERRAAWKFLRYRSTYEGDEFWDSFNLYEHNLTKLAGQICERTPTRADDCAEGTVTYVRTGVPAVTGRIVCMDSLSSGEYLVKGAPRRLVSQFTEYNVRVFLHQYKMLFKDPLLMFGLWRTHGKNSYGPWMMCLCHHLGARPREEYYEYGFDADEEAIDYIGTKF